MTTERILRFRVERQLNDAVRNPEGRWSLVFSSNDVEVAGQVADEEQARWGKFGDKIRVRDGGTETVVRRADYI